MDRAFRLLLLCCFLVSLSRAQGTREYLGDESVLYAETKQLNQFFRRFNAEEKVDGQRMYPGDSLYHNPRLRAFYLNMLFDQSSATLPDSLKRAFTSDVVRSPFFLDFHGGNWVAEVQCTFRYQGVDQPLTLFMELEQAEVGSKWVFRHVLFEPYRKQFYQPQLETGEPFLHPLSHELDFMNLSKVFREPSQSDRFASDAFRPDYLTLFLFEAKKGYFTFQTVNKVRFHFYQMSGWYFQLNDVQREGPNRGWLISHLFRVPASQEQKLQDFIFRR